MPEGAAAGRTSALRAGLSGLLLLGCVIAIVMMGDDAGRRELLGKGAILQALRQSSPQLDWSAFDQQLHNDWEQKAAAKKAGRSSAEVRLHERKEEDERRMLAQKRLEVKKVKEEKEMEALERNIELEASNQLAARNTQLSDAIVQSAPQLQPQVVFQGHFQPGYDAKSAGEAAAELAAWGPSSNANWERVLAQQRQASLERRAGAYPTQQLAYNPIPQQRSVAMATGPGSTDGDALHQAWVAHQALTQAMAKTQTLAAVKSAALEASAHPDDGRKESALTKALTKYLMTSERAVNEAAAGPEVAAGPKPAAPEDQVAMSAALAGASSPGRQPGTVAESEAANVRELELQARLAKEQAHNALLEEKLKKEQLQAAEMQMRSTPSTASSAEVRDAIFQRAQALPVVDAQSGREEDKWAKVMKMAKQQSKQRQQQQQQPKWTVADLVDHPALVTAQMQCCDDACDTVSTRCKAPDAVAHKASSTLGAKAGGSTAAAAVGSSAEVPADATEKQLVQYLVSGTPAQKHEAAGLLYAETSSHNVVESTAKTAVPAKSKPPQHLIKPVKEVMIKGIRRCCDSSCNYINTVCPNTGALDHFAVEEYADGKGPTDSQLQQWLVHGTQVQKDEAAAVFFAKSHGVVAKERKKLLAEKKKITAEVLHAGHAHDVHEETETGGYGDSTTDAVEAVGGSHGSSESAKQAGHVVSEAESIVGDLTAEGH